MASGFDSDLWDALADAYDELEAIGAGVRACAHVERSEVELRRREGEDTTVREMIDSLDTSPDYYEGIVALVVFPEIRATYEPEVQHAFLMQALEYEPTAIQVVLTFGDSLPAEAMVLAHKTIRDWDFMAHMAAKKGNRVRLQEW